MVDVIIKWVRKYYNKFVHSIAFLPAVMGAASLILAIALITLDDSKLGMQLKEEFDWINLKDPETARAIVSTVAAGIISLTVFSFSMVMVVMSQVASQMSNRMLDNIIGNRVQKLILGFYTGTIVFALFLLTNISKAEKGGAEIPSISILFLLLLTMFDIFLFINFLHYITQSLRYEQLIKRIHKRTNETLDKLVDNKNATFGKNTKTGGHEILAHESGYYQGYNEKRMMKLAERHNIVIEFLHPAGTYILKDTPFIKIQGEIDEKELKKMLVDLDFYYGQEIDKNAYYGFFHLTEVAVKALSPGINDPGTAVFSINALTDLFARIIKQPIANEITDTQGNTKIVTQQIPFDKLFANVVLPIWDYGKKDRFVQNGLTRMLQQLLCLEAGKEYTHLFEKLLEEVKTETSKLTHL